MNINSLDRFLEAQDRMYQIALSEIKKGSKRSHWMWFIFPQLRGLGSSKMSYIFGVNGIEEAKEYLNHPVLSERLIEITEALLAHKGKDIYDIMGDIDDMKLKSSMTLFALISEDGSVFHQVLECFYDGEMDYKTVKLLNINI
ncbi:MAG: DUF1810 domain-containing protein [Ruminococcaceae bacterium]|nr:DUF1810 domain-containing protein [Oscillospiraceae bacterium]